MNINRLIGVKSSDGQSILEIIVALAVFSLIGATLASLIIGSFSTLGRSEDIFRASGLADEGIEAVRNVSQRDWQEMNLDNAVADNSSGRWVLGAGTGELISDKFFRSISLLPVYRDGSGNITSATTSGASLDNGSKKAAVRVEWLLDTGSTGWVERSAYITDWNFDIWEQADWSGGNGQDIWTDATKYQSDGGDLDLSVPGTLTLAQIATSTYPASSFAISSAFDTGTSSIFKEIRWQEDLPAGCGTSCGVKFQIKTAASQADLDSAPWLGPLGTGSSEDYFASSSGTTIPSMHNGDRWIMYRAELFSNTSFTPALHEVGINYKNLD